MRIPKFFSSFLSRSKKLFSTRSNEKIVKHSDGFTRHFSKNGTLVKKITPSGKVINYGKRIKK